MPAPLAIAAKLGGPYYVDDAEIGKPGSCEFESWGSFANNGDHILVFSPACVVNLGVPVELGTNLVGFSPDIGNSIVSLTAKTVPIPISRMGFGLAISSAIIYDQVDRTVNGAIFNVPMTFDFSKQLRLNLNFGAQYNGDPKAFLATAGVGVAWNFVKERGSVTPHAGWSTYWLVCSRCRQPSKAAGQQDPRERWGRSFRCLSAISCFIALPWA